MFEANARIYLSPPYFGDAERRAVSAAFDTGYVAPTGPCVDEFERNIAEVARRKAAVAVSSGTAALDLILDELGVDESWTVVAPTLTFIATVGSAWHRGASLVFVDCADDMNVDPELVEKALRETTGKKLFIGVDLYGKCCDYGLLKQICDGTGTKFVMDSAEAFGSKRGETTAGSGGFAAVFSFNGNKIITTSGGGAIVTDDMDAAFRMRKKSQQNRENLPWYEHNAVGYNYRMSNLLAALGNAQIKRLEHIIARRRYNYEFYSRFFTMKKRDESDNAWLSIAILESAKERDQVMVSLSSDNIESRPVWKPMHLQSVFRHCKTYGGKCAEEFFERGICLPSGTGMTPEDFARIERAIHRALAKQ